MLDAIRSVEYYPDDGCLSRSPPLKARFVKATPSPPPPPQITTVVRHQPIGQRIRTRPTQGDTVLIREMDPSRPDIAQKASEQALNSDSESDQEPGSGDDEILDVETSNTATARFHGQPVPSATRPANQQPSLLEVLASAPDPKVTATHRDSVIEDEVIRPFGFAATDRGTPQPSAAHAAPNGVRYNINETNRTPSISTALSNVSLQPPNQLPNSLSQEYDSATSPGLRQLTIPQRGGLSADTLPALQAPSPARDAAAGSPSQQLPSFRHMDDIARSATSDHEATRSNSISFPHRQPVSSVGQSPTSVVRALSISSHSPATPFPPLSASSPMSAHEISHRGCTAAPFQTQYLLNSHTYVHSSNRPHYCPVKDCPRGEGGKGFKRKNEMIRHGLVHQSPGYVCPFCPDREHKYPRPDNLQRHVRVHHTDKDNDDPQLRDVLAQRPEGGSRGRRRRVSDSGH
ncbi:zinc finger c2h2-type integrase DNA-binding protein [Alternaria alternata]|nr:zinc finger c2h2-type integrase DNA-binding protein [Alternaria alternata]